MQINKYFLSFLLVMTAVIAIAQPKPEDKQFKLDGVAAVVGNEIILDSVR